MLKLVFVILPLLLGIYALIDCAQTPGAETRGLPKPAWLAVIVVPVVGPLLWLLVGSRRSRLFALLWPSDDNPVRPARGRQVAPDDDPDFLRGLGRGGGRPARPPQRGRPPSRDEEALLEEWERDLERGDTARGGRAQRGGSETSHEDPGPDDEGGESSTDGAPRV